MKIAFICHDAELTGAPKMGIEIANLLSYSFEITLIVKRGGPLVDGNDQNISRFKTILNTNTNHEISEFSYEERLEIAINILREERPDLLYVNSAAAADWCEAGRKMNIPVVLHSHEMKTDLLALRETDIFKTNIADFVDLLITVSKEAENDIIEVCAPSFKHILSLNAGIDIEKVLELSKVRAHASPKNVFGETLAPGRKPLLSMCGFASHRKGADIFFNLAKGLPQYDFIWIGPWAPSETPANPVFSDYENNPLTNFFLTNSVLNPYPYFKLADAFILTSREDPNPLIVMEAMLLVNTCIGFSRTGGSKELLKKYGILLHGEINTERLISFLGKIDFTHSQKLLTSGKFDSFAATYDLNELVQKIRPSLLNLCHRSPVVN